MISIRRQLTRTLIVALLLLIGGGLGLVYALVRTSVVRTFDSTLKTKALALSTMTRMIGDKVCIDFTDRFMRGFDRRERDDFFQIRRLDGTMVARSESLADGEMAFPEDVLQKRVFWNLTLPDGSRGRAMGFAFAPRTEKWNMPAPPKVIIVVASKSKALDETLWVVLGSVVGCGVLMMTVTPLLVARVLRRGLRPVDEIGEQAARIDSSSLDVRFEASEMPVELEPIARRLNDLLARLQASFERERRFSADLAHELRTPLAELRSMAECALKWPESRDPAVDEDTLAIAKQMEGLVTRMLALARSEGGQVPVATEDIDIAAEVNATWTAFAQRAEARRLAVSIDVPSRKITADPVLLRSVLNNLFDNVVEYAPAYGEVRVNCVSVEGGPVLRVANQAPGLSPEDVGRLFERFWRKEAARSGSEHSGLGLSLARAFASAMGWRLTVALEDGGWLVFSLNPGAAPQEPRQ